MKIIISMLLSLISFAALAQQQPNALDRISYSLAQCISKYELSIDEIRDLKSKLSELENKKIELENKLKELEKK